MRSALPVLLALLLGCDGKVPPPAPTPTPPPPVPGPSGPYADAVDLLNKALISACTEAGKGSPAEARDEIAEARRRAAAVAAAAGGFDPLRTKAAGYLLQDLEAALKSLDSTDADRVTRSAESALEIGARLTEIADLPPTSQFPVDKILSLRWIMRHLTVLVLLARHEAPETELATGRGSLQHQIEEAFTGYKDLTPEERSLLQQILSTGYLIIAEPESRSNSLAALDRQQQLLRDFLQLPKPR